MSTQDTPETRLYAVMTDSRRPFDKTVLARLKPSRSRETGFWTEDQPDEVWQMDRNTAEEVFSGLSLNNPRIVRAEKAIALITAQRDAKAAPPEAEDEPFLGGP